MSDFLAEARVLVRPDTTSFRAELTAQVEAAAKGVVVPVQVTAAPVAAAGTRTQAAQTAALAASQTEQAAAAQAMGAAAQRATTETVRLTTAQKAADVATRKLALSQGEVAGAASAAAAAQVRLTRTAAAVAAAERAVDLAVRSGDVALIDATRNTLALAAAQQTETVSALEAARAQQHHAATLGQVGKAGAASGASLLGLRGAVLTAGAAFLGATVAIQSGVKALREFAAFETSLNVFRVTADATANDMQRVSETARQLGSDLTLPGVSANEAADALAQLSRAGLTVEDSIAGVRGTLQLATAAAIENEEAVTLVASALNAFQLGGQEAATVADLLAASANESQGSITDMGLALQQSAAAAHQAGVTLEDTVALLTLLARAGLRGSDAGTSLRVALLRLINPSKAAGEQINRLNINVRDMTGNVRPEVFADLATALQRMSKAQRDATLATIFGADAFRAAAIIGQSGARGLEETRVATQEQGVAAEVAAARTEGLTGAVEKLKNEASRLGLVLGEAFGGPVTTALGAFAGLLGGTADALGFVFGQSKSVAEVNEQQAKSWVDLVRKVGEFNQAASDLGNTRAQETARELTEALEDQFPASLKAASAIEDYRQSVADAALQSENLNNRIDESVDRFAKIVAAASDAATAVSLFLSPSEKTNVAAIRAGGTEGLSDDIAAAQLEAERAAKALATFEADPNHPAKSRARFAKLVEDDARAQAELARLQQQAADQATAAAKSARQAAQNALDAEDEALQARLALSRQQAENRVAAAELTPALADDIRRQEQFIALLRAQENVIRTQIHDADTRKALLAALRSAELAAEKELENLVAQRKQAQQTARDAATDILGQRLRLAELRGDDDQILAALNAAIADARKRVKAAKTLSDRLDEQIALQELINQKKQLLGEKAEEGNDVERFFFEQLQAQQGFASNLLGNLIPSGQTSGLVGLPSPVTSAASVSPPGGVGGVTDIGAAVSAQQAVAEGRSRTSPTAGQASTTNEILRRILKELRDINRAADNPEAIYQAKMGMARMDGGGGNVEMM